VLPAGHIQQTDGSVWEVGTFPVSKVGRQATANVTFATPFAGTPVVFLTVQTGNDPTPLQVRLKKVAASGFQASLELEQALSRSDHGEETVGYLAIYVPGGSLKFLSTSGVFRLDGIDLPWLLQLLPKVDETPVPVLSQRLWLQEATSSDAEVNHGYEPVALLQIADKVFACPQKASSRDVATLRRIGPPASSTAEWGTVELVTKDEMIVPFGRTFIDPVVVVKPFAKKKAGPGILRVTDVQADHFKLKFQDWDYLAAKAKPAQVRAFYMVAEAGEFALGAVDVKAGKTTTAVTANADNVAWEPVSFPSAFAVTPALFSSVASSNDSAPVISRAGSVTASGFNLALQEEDAADNGTPAHLLETVHWIAMSPGSTTVDGLSVDVQLQPAALSSKPLKMSFVPPYTLQYPFLLADMNSANDLDPAVVRYGSIKNSLLQLYVEEETSLDRDKNHLFEDMSLFLGE